MRGEDGAVGGLEGLAFGVLVFVFGLLLVMSTWSVIDTKLAIAAAAREAARSYVESPVGEDARVNAEQAAVSVLALYGEDPGAPGFEVRTRLAGGGPAPETLERCDVVSIEVRYRVELYLPYADRLVDYTVSTTASEVVDPLRSGLGGEAVCVG